MIGIVDALYRSSPKAGPSSVPPFLSPPQSLHPTATPVRYRSPGTRIVDGKMENRKSVDRLFRGQLRPESPRRHKKRVSDKIANPYKFWSEREDSNLRHLGPKPSVLSMCANFDLNHFQNLAVVTVVQHVQ